MTTYSPGNQPQGNQKPGMKEITPELVQKISERVLAMLLSELRIEKERFRPWSQSHEVGKGRRYGR